MAYTHWPSVSAVFSALATVMSKPLPSWTTLVHYMTACFRATLLQYSAAMDEDDMVNNNHNENEIVSDRRCNNN